mmetsp:Transcript_113842/g.367845  ORF Transcript_113842/g.367845 Transcript_113842/m.367845 type:complete len:88 (-) Transcript_113842:149-412(-)
MGWRLVRGWHHCGQLGMDAYSAAIEVQPVTCIQPHCCAHVCLAWHLFCVSRFCSYLPLGRLDLVCSGWTWPRSASVRDLEVSTNAGA